MGFRRVQPTEGPGLGAAVDVACCIPWGSLRATKAGQQRLADRTT